MADWAPHRFLTNHGGESVISTISLWAGYGSASSSTPSSTAWPTANMAVFCPILLERAVVVTKLAVGAGVTAAGNFKVGIFDVSGNNIVASAATAKGSSVEHIIDITDTAIGPGRYYLGMAADGTNNYAMYTPAGTSPVPLQKSRVLGTLEAASAYSSFTSAQTMVTRTTVAIPAIAAYLRSY